mmetsp:Transcript_26113/g.83637  ORF Transcript_26113/g.83637 Transcript_26113/m.83637 type:complete len:246 (+) Transcript_26113:107-844(+)
MVHVEDRHVRCAAIVRPQPDEGQPVPRLCRVVVGACDAQDGPSVGLHGIGAREAERKLEREGRQPVHLRDAIAPARSRPGVSQELVVVRCERGGRRRQRREGRRRRRRRRQRFPKEIQRHDVGDPSVRDRHPSVPLTNAPHLVVPAALQAIAVEHCAAAVALCEPLEFGATARGIPLCASCVEAGQRARRALRDPVGLRPGRREPVGVAGRQHRAATIGQSEGVDAIAPERLMVGRQGHVGVVVR